MAADGDAHERARTLARHLNKLREPRMRVRALARVLIDEPPANVVAMLHALVIAARTEPSDGVGAAIETLAATLTTDHLIPYPVRVELYEAASAADHAEISRMLFEGRASAVDDDDAAERPLEPRGRPITLGERKSLARGHNREILEKLLVDPHPDVVELLIANPHITEKDVVSIATHRPARPAALTVIALSERWMPRYAVKRALALNPYTPVQIAIRLVTTLTAADLRAIAADATLAPAVREQAETLLTPRL